ncbi:MAG: MBOAT family protein [Schleiferiaceae bacterium]|nr:MBOAT family protein [Schleiferiaceae bacterium]
MFSYIFYGFWSYTFLLLIIFSSLLDFFLGRAIGDTQKPAHRKYLLYLSIIGNLGVLMYFKYMNFFIENLNFVLQQIGVQLSTIDLNVVLPVGISFYTFQTLSYTVDVYRRKIAPETNLLNFLCFVSFFPQLVAGPIERAANMLPQFARNRIFDYSAASLGIKRIIWGLFIKVFVAGVLGEFVNMVHAAPTEHSPIHLFFGMLFFVVQLYCDFSGYSHIAIGLGLLFGFSLSENFKYPLIHFTNSLVFFRRWHITLTTWFRDYVGNPLRNATHIPKKHVTIPFFVLFLIGLWHGANWTYILAFCSIVLYGFLGLNRLRLSGRKRILQIILWNISLATHLVLFRSENLSNAMAYFKSFTLNSPSVDWSLLSFPLGTYCMFLTSEIWADKCGKTFQMEKLTSYKIVNYIIISIALLIISGYMESSTEFIYFAF